MTYTPYRRASIAPVIDTALVENLLARVTDLNGRMAPLESNYAALAASAGGAVNTNEVQRGTISALQDMVGGLASYVTDAALSSIPINTATSYANFPPFAVRAFGVENRLNVIGALGAAAIDYGAGPNTSTGDLMPAALGKLQARLIARGFDPGSLGEDIASALVNIEVTLRLAEAAYLPGTELLLTLTGLPPAATVGVSYSFVPGVAYASAPVVFTLNGTLPAGLVFSTSTGAITGTPTATATFTGSIGAVDAKSSALLGVSIVIAAATVTPAPTLSQPSISPTSGAVGSTFTAIDGVVTNGTLSGRRWLLGTTAIGTGSTITPNAAGLLTLENSALGTNGATITATSAAVTVSSGVQPLTISGTPGNATVGTAYFFTPTTAGGTGTKVFALTGTLPAGLTFSTSTGGISGTPTAAATTSGLNITVTDTSGSASLGAFSIVVGTNALAVLGVSPQAFTQGAAAGTEIGTISSTIAGVTAASVNSTKLAINSAGTKLLVGVAAASANEVINATLNGTDGGTSSISIICNPAASSAATVNFFTTDGASSASYAGTVSPEAIRHSLSGKTVKLWEAWDGTLAARTAKARIFNPATKLWSPPYYVFTSQLTDDDHGVPAIDIASNDRAYAYGGAHDGQNMQVSMSGVGGSTGDFSTWTVQPSIAPATYSVTGLGYPHPVAVGTRMYEFMRFENRPDKMTFGHLTAAIAADGTLTRSTTSVILFDFENNSRIYAIEPLLMSSNGVDGVFRLCFTFADYNDTYRQDVFVCDYDTAAGVIRSLDGTYTRSTATPMLLGTARTNIRITTHFENNLYGGVPTHCFDSAGNYQVAYSQGASGVNNQGQFDYPIFERVKPAGGALTAAVSTGAVVKQRYDVFNYIPKSSGVMDLYFTSLDARGYNRTGDQSYVRRTGVSGAWAAPVSVIAANAYLGYDRVHGVKNADESVRGFFSENVVPGGGSGGALNATAGNVRVVAFSETGIITYPFQPRTQTQAFAARLQVQPTTTEMKALDGLIASYVDEGIWAQADAIYVPAWLSNNPQAMLLNLIADQYNMAVQGNVTPQLVSGKTGYAMKTDGVAGSYLRSTLVPSTATGLKYTQNNGTMAVYPVTEGQEAAQSMGFDTGSSVGTSFIIPRNTSDLVSCRINDNATNQATAANATAVQFILARRTAATTKQIYLGGSKTAAGSGAQTSSGPATSPLALLGLSTLASTRQIGFAFMGAGIGLANQPIIEAPAHRFLIDMGVL